MTQRYPFDWIDGREVPPLVIDSDYVLDGSHTGTVYVEGGSFTLAGTLKGTLSIRPGVKALIAGKQMGTVSVSAGSIVTVSGVIKGTTNVAHGATLVIESSGRLAGSLANAGAVIVRGVFGGARSGTGRFVVEPPGQIKQPVVRDGISYYEW